MDISADMTAILASGDLTTLSMVYAQGANTKTITSGWRAVHGVRAGDPGGAALDGSSSSCVFPASAFTTGFSGSSPVVPSPGDGVTISGEDVWTVDTADLTAGGELWLLALTKRTTRGTL